MLISDDHSVGRHVRRRPRVQRAKSGCPITVVRQPKNLGYGGNQKAGYQWAIDHELDIVVLLHGDGQYAPELLPDDRRAARARARPTRCSARG